jgi:hypothetical protein
MTYLSRGGRPSPPPSNFGVDGNPLRAFAQSWIKEADIMSDEELKYPRWQAPPLDLILEVHLAELRDKLRKVESAIFERLQASSSEKNNHNEERSLQRSQPS